jgi:hypothetical protein
LNQQNDGGLHDCRLTTVAAPSSGDPPPEISDEPGQLFGGLSTTKTSPPLIVEIFYIPTNSLGFPCFINSNES